MGDDDAQGREGLERIPPPPFDDQARLTKLLGILPSELVLRDDRNPSRLQHTNNLLQGPAAALAVIDVVQAQIGNDHIEGALRNGISCAGTPSNVQRSLIPSNSRLWWVAASELPPTSSLDQISMPVAVPPPSRFAAPANSKPRPQPTSSTCSSPRHVWRESIRSR